MQDWKVTNVIAGVDIAGLEIEGLEVEGLEIAGLDSGKSNNLTKE